jgi:crotonobetainyl-CoA:carnitine CoA-transferase CaiB-like acyl-CoA transferase
MEKLQRCGVPAGVVQTAADIAGDLQLKARSFFVEMEGKLGESISDASPIKMSGTPARYHSPAPAPDQDNKYVYKKLLRMSDNDVKKLKQKKVI